MLIIANSHLQMPILNRSENQKSIEPSPLRPHTTIAMEKVKTAASEAHARANNIGFKVMRGSL